MVHFNHRKSPLLQRQSKEWREWHHQTVSLNSVYLTLIHCPHFQCLSVDQYINNSDIALSETWLYSSVLTESLKPSPEYHLYRQDFSVQNNRPQGGVATYVKKSFRVVSELHCEGVNLQYQCLVLSCRMNPSKRLIVILLYVQPNTQNVLFFQLLDN